MTRHFVATAFADVPKDFSDRAAVLVSELATNAIQHAGTAFVVRVERNPEQVCVEVIDSGGGEPMLRSAAPNDYSGRGLQIVDVLSDEWGVRPAGQGKSVWFVISLPKSSSKVG